MAIWREELFAWMTRNAQGAALFFRLPPNRVVEARARRSNCERTLEERRRAQSSAATTGTVRLPGGRYLALMSLGGPRGRLRRHRDEPALRDARVLRRDASDLARRPRTFSACSRSSSGRSSSIISIKYLVFVLRADNRGRAGSSLSWLSCDRGSRRDSRGSARGRSCIGIFGAALLYGDGMITPAISVLVRGRRPVARRARLPQPGASHDDRDPDRALLHPEAGDATGSARSSAR